MCLTTVGRVVAVDAAGDRAAVDIGDAVRNVLLTPVTAGGEVVAVGDWLLVQFGLAVRRLDEPTVEWLRDGRVPDGQPPALPAAGSELIGGTDAN